MAVIRPILSSWERVNQSAWSPPTVMTEGAHVAESSGYRCAEPSRSMRAILPWWTRVTHRESSLAAVMP